MSERKKSELLAEELDDLCFHIGGMKCAIQDLLDEMPILTTKQFKRFSQLAESLTDACVRFKSLDDDLGRALQEEHRR